MKKATLFLLVLFISVASFSQSTSAATTSTYYLIAHRGGVVDSTYAENSRPALEAAIKRGYSMVEVDLRLTKDSVLIVHHDRDLRRYFHVDRLVSDMTWNEISQLRSDKNNSAILRFDELLSLCSGRIDVMIDLKISGVDTLLFAGIVDLLEKHKLKRNAIMIGTEESTPWFTSRIPLSCTREQLEANKKLPGFDPSHYFLFGRGISRDDKIWADRNGITTIGVLNSWHYRKVPNFEAAVAADVSRLKAAGITRFQLDSEFDHYFINADVSDINRN